MPDILLRVTDLRRPRLLIRAARAGLADYNRNRDLRRLMRLAVAPGPDRALCLLVEEEAQIEAARKAGGAAYSLTRHIELLIAMIAEARLVPLAGRGA